MFIALIWRLICYFEICTKLENTEYNYEILKISRYFWIIINLWLQVVSKTPVTNYWKSLIYNENFQLIFFTLRLLLYFKNRNDIIKLTVGNKIHWNYTLRERKKVLRSSENFFFLLLILKLVAKFLFLESTP